MKEDKLRKIKILIRNAIFPVPKSISNNYIAIDGHALSLIEESIRKHYHTGWRNESKYTKEKYEHDLAAHLYGRLEADRRNIVPWLNNAFTLKGRSILEIGCGTGSSTIALAEQGARVTGIDIDQGALLVAAERATAYGVDAEFRLLNAQSLPSTFKNVRFDAIVFFACLEHMTISERLTSLRDAWQMLPSGGFLVVVETPNRLWYFDGHTSMLPFFNWLPNELAFSYSKFSSRENFKELYHEYDSKSKEHFLRRGRGLSFHEFDIAIGKVSDLKVISSLSTFQGIRYNLRKSSIDRKYKSLLMSIYKNIHEGFFDSSIYLVIQKS